MEGGHVPLSCTAHHAPSLPKKFPPQGGCARQKAGALQRPCGAGAANGGGAYTVC